MSRSVMKIPSLGLSTSLLYLSVALSVKSVWILEMFGRLSQLKLLFVAPSTAFGAFFAERGEVF